MSFVIAPSQRDKDGKALSLIYKTWEAAAIEAGGQPGYDVFVECLLHAAPKLPDTELLRLYNLATSGENPDAPDFRLIDALLRKKGIVLKRKGDGLESIQGMKIDDIKTMTTTATLFMTKPKKGGAAGAIAPAAAVPPGGGGGAPGGEAPPASVPPGGGGGAPGGEAPPASAEGTRAKSLWARASSTHVSHASNRILEIMRQMEEMELQAEEEIA
jgi:hypothetical protein